MNQSDLIQSHKETLLTRTGEQQAEATGKAIRERFDSDAVYASDYIRARRTAELMDFGVDVNTDTRLEPFDFGDIAGQDLATFIDENPEYSPDSEGAADLAFPGGESTVDVYNRVADFLDDIAETHSGDETAVVVTHNTQVTVGRAYVRDRDAEAALGVEVSNCTGFIAEHTGDKWEFSEDAVFAE